MTVLNILVEGQTEETFVRQVLSRHLKDLEIYVKVRRVITNKSKGVSGGLPNYEKAKNDLNRWLKEDKENNTRFTTMFDLYALPKDFPEFEQSNKLLDSYIKVKALESAFAKDINH